MITEKIIGNLGETSPDVPVDYVEIDWFEAEKRRIRKTTQGGRDIGIQCQQLKRYWHLPRIKNQTRFQRK